MKIFLNGEPRDIPENLTLAELLEWLHLPADRLAVERNREIATRSTWSQTAIQPGDRLEVVHFVGGGSEVDGPLTNHEPSLACSSKFYGR